MTETLAPASAVRHSQALGLVVASTLIGMLAYAGPLGNAVTLTQVLDTGPRGATWVLSSMSAGLGAALLPLGIISERAGRRLVFAWGAIVFTIGSALCALTDAVGPFVAGRVVQGVGAAGMIATGLGLVSFLSVNDRHRSLTAAWWAGAMGAGIALGPILTGLLDHVGGWRWFYVGLAVAGAALAVGTRRLLPQVPQVGGPRPSVWGFVLLTIGLGALLAGLVEFRSGSRPVGAAGFAVALLAIAALALCQRTPRLAVLEPALLRGRPFLGSTLAGFGTGFGVISGMSFAGTYAVAGLGLTTLHAGLLLSLWSAVSAVSGLVLRRFATGLSGRLQMVYGLVGVGVGLLLMTGMSPGSSTWRLVPGLVVCGIASGVLNGGLARQAVASVAPAQAAIGTSANNAARYLGAAIGITLVTLLAPSADAAGLATGWNLASVLTGVASLLCAVAVLRIDRTT